MARNPSHTPPAAVSAARSLSVAPPVDTSQLRLAADAARQLLLALEVEQHTLREAIDRFESDRLTSPPLSPHTIAWSRIALDRIREVAGDRPVGGSCRELALELYRRHSEANASLACCRLAAVLRHAERIGWRQGAHDIGALAVVKSKPRERWLTVDEMQRFASALAEMRASWERYGCTVDALLCIALTGARVSSVCSWRWADVAADFSSIRMDAKGRSVQQQLCESAQRILHDRVARSGWHTWVFPASRGEGHIKRGACFHAMREACRRAGIERASPHTLRHTMATLALKDGVHTEVIRRALGHSTQFMTARYAHVMSDDVRRALHGVSKKWNGGRDVG